MGHRAWGKPIKEPSRCRVLSLGKPLVGLGYRGESNGRSPLLCLSKLLPAECGSCRPQVVPARWEGRRQGGRRALTPRRALLSPPTPHRGANSTPGRVSHAAVPGGGSGARERRGPGREADRRLRHCSSRRSSAGGAAGQGPLRASSAAGPRCAPRWGESGRCPRPDSPGPSGAPARRRLSGSCRPAAASRELLAAAAGGPFGPFLAPSSPPLRERREDLKARASGGRRLWQRERETEPSGRSPPVARRSGAARLPQPKPLSAVSRVRG